MDLAQGVLIHENIVVTKYKKTLKMASSTYVFSIMGYNLMSSGNHAWMANSCVVNLPPCDLIVVIEENGRHKVVNVLKTYFHSKTTCLL